VGKYVDHFPFYRQIKQFKCWGVEIPDSTLYGWTAAAVQFITSIYDRMLEITLSGHYLKVDESPLKVLLDS